jgi:hypothetical protein
MLSKNGVDGLSLQHSLAVNQGTEPSLSSNRRKDEGGMEEL